MAWYKSQLAEVMTAWREAFGDRGAGGAPGAVPGAPAARLPLDLLAAGEFGGFAEAQVVAERVQLARVHVSRCIGRIHTMPGRVMLDHRGADAIGRLMVS